MEAAAVQMSKASWDEAEAGASAQGQPELPETFSPKATIIILLK